MPSFDVSCEMNWAELDNAVNQTMREIPNRFDFKGIKVGIEVDRKLKLLNLTCSVEGKLEALRESLQIKMGKRGLSLLSFDFQEPESASAGGARQAAKIRSGIEKEDAKKIIAAIKDQKLKVQAQIQDEQVRVTGKKRDDLQEVMSFLKTKQNDFKLPLQFGNFRD